jgi:hypothetical protein
MSKLSKRLQPTIVKSTKTQSTLCLSGADIIELLCEAGVEPVRRVSDVPRSERRRLVREKRPEIIKVTANGKPVTLKPRKR